MVGTEYGMAWEMTHGLAAGCVSCIADQSVGGRERERETRVYAYGRTNKEASIEVVSGIGAEDDRWDEDGRGERSWSGREMKRADERRRERERLTLG